MDKESLPVQIIVNTVPDVTNGSPKTPMDTSVLSTSPSTWATPGSTLGAEPTDVGRKSPIPTTPSAVHSVHYAGSQSVWATPGVLECNEKVYSFREILSMPTLNDSSPQSGPSDAPLKTPSGILNGVEVMNGVDAMNGSIHEAMNGSVHEVDLTPKPTPDRNESVSSLASHLAVPPNTPQVLVEDPSILSSDADVTVYEKTPFGVMPASERVSGVQIIEKSAQTVIGEAEKGSSRTYIVPETTPRVEEPVKLVHVVNVSATPFDPSSDSVSAAVMNETAVDDIDGPTEPVAGAVNGKSQTVITVLGDDSERLVAEGPDCDDLLGGFLVRPCPSMRPYRRLCAKGFLIVLLILVVAFIVVMILINRSS